MKCFFDGSGKEKDNEFVTLAGYAGIQSDWAAFEVVWSAKLKEFEAPYLHMSRLWSASTNNIPFILWSKSRKEDFVNEMLGTLEAAQLSQIQGVSCTVDVKAYRDCRKQLGNRAKDLQKIPNICVVTCVGPLIHQEKTGKPYDCLEIHFDKGEEFFSLMLDMWKRKRHPMPFSECIASMTAMDMRQSCGIQLADLLGWLLNRKYTKRDKNIWLDRLEGAIPHSHRFINKRFHQYSL
jgi:hypothetical protein